MFEDECSVIDLSKSKTWVARAKNYFALIYGHLYIFLYTEAYCIHL